MSNKQVIKKFIILILASFTIGALSTGWGFDSKQSLAIGIFSASIIGTLLFWHLRVSIAFLGTSLLLATKTINIEHFIEFASFEIILFLVGMMILVGFLKDAGFFTWIVSLILRVKNFTATKFLIFICVLSALFSCAVDEVTSIIFIIVAVLEICDFLEVNPMPFIIISVLATNIGSAGTVLGNPIGILIAAKSGLTFEDFLIRAFPLMCAALAVAIFLMLIWFKKPLKHMEKKIKEHGANDMLIKLISVPMDRQQKTGFFVFIATIFFIGMHHRLELFLDLEPNTLLFITPIISSAIIMLWRSHRALHYIKEDVEWFTLLFFIFFFAQAGALKYTNASAILAQKLFLLSKGNPTFLVSSILWIGSISSSIVDNVVVVASFIPIIQSFQQFSQTVKNDLWWALLFGGCFGGNITLIGSTANIVAIGLLEKEKKIKIKFFQWFWIGLVVGIATTAVAWVYLLIF